MHRPTLIWQFLNLWAQVLLFLGWFGLVHCRPVSLIYWIRRWGQFTILSLYQIPVAKAPLIICIFFLPIWCVITYQWLNVIGIYYVYLAIVLGWVANSLFFKSSNYHPKILGLNIIVNPVNLTLNIMLNFYWR